MMLLLPLPYQPVMKRKRDHRPLIKSWQEEPWQGSLWPARQQRQTVTCSKNRYERPVTCALIRRLTNPSRSAGTVREKASLRFDQPRRN
jgi:hypothetical protein